MKWIQKEHLFNLMDGAFRNILRKTNVEGKTQVKKAWRN